MMEKVSSDIIGQSDGTTDILVETPHYLVPIIAIVVLCVVIGFVIYRRKQK